MALTDRERDHGWREMVEAEFALAVDLGQSIDPTAIAVIERVKTFHRLECGPQSVLGRRKDEAETFNVRHLQRLPLGLSYPEQVAEVARLLARPPLKDGCTLVIDETGVGRAVGDLFDAAGMEPTRVTITGGLDQTVVGRRRHHVAKQILISGLDARLHTGELRFAADLHEAGAMAEELKDFRRKVSAAGRFSYDARVGKHDDLVLAVSMGVWHFAGRTKPPVAAIGMQRRLG